MGFVGDFSLNHKSHQICWHLRRSAVLRIHFPHLLPLWRRSSESWSRSKPGAIISAAEALLTQSTLLWPGTRSSVQTPAFPQGTNGTATLHGYTLLAFWAKMFVNMGKRCSMRFGNVLIVGFYVSHHRYTEPWWHPLELQHQKQMIHLVWCVLAFFYLNI